MLIDKEKVLKEIDKRVEGLLSFRKSWADDEANSLNELKHFIAALPAAEEVERWVVHKDGKPRIICEDDESIFGKGGDDCHKYFIRRADK